MPIKKIENVDVDFPYEPYDCQMAYMGKVIQALDMKCDAALESPTGTGKTLSLLCATLGWLQKQKVSIAPSIEHVMAMLDDKATGQVRSAARSLGLPTIYYCSRTHSQLAQVVRELNKTVYKCFPTAVLASRDQLCIHDKVLKEKDNRIKSAMCRAMTKKHTCHFYNQWDGCKTTELSKIYPNSEAMDIEDLVNIAKRHKHCPYFRSRQMQESAELVLLPYNYLIDPELRRIHKIDLKGSVVIFDEAHNLESICEQSISVEISTTDIALCIRELKKAIELLQEETELLRTEMDNSEMEFGAGMSKNGSKENKLPFEIGCAALVLSKLFDFEQFIDQAYKDQGNFSKSFMDFPGKVFPGEYMLQLLEKAQFTSTHASETILLLTKVSDYLHEKAENESAISTTTVNGGAVAKLSSFLSVVYSSHVEESITSKQTQQIVKYDCTKPEVLAKDFRLYMVKEKGKDVGEQEEEIAKITLNYWCFSAGLAMKYLKARGVRSIIVTSGTLSPLSNFMTNIGLNFGCCLENAHAAQSNQIIAGIIRRGPADGGLSAHPGSASSGEILNGNFANRSNESYHLSIGDSLVKLARTVPQGMLVFFSSYALMDTMLKTFKSRVLSKNMTVWQQLETEKKIVVEPKSKGELGVVRLEFTTAVREGKGAIFMAVCRGKVSEGIDFADADSRAVVIIGIPYPPVADPRVKLKRLYLEEKKAITKDKDQQSADNWYTMEGYRAVNQAIGRVLRHVNDFGIVALLDSRFASAPASNYPSWMRPSMRHIEKYEDFNVMIDTFFRDRCGEIMKSRQKLLEICCNSGSIRNVRRKRVNVGIEDSAEFEKMLERDHEEIQSKIVKRTEPKKITSIGDLENCNKAEKEVIVLDDDDFGVVKMPALPQQPPKKKMKVVKNVGFQASQTRLSQSQSQSSSGTNMPASDEQPSTSNCTASSSQTEPNKRDISSIVPPELQQFLKIDNKQLNAMLGLIGPDKKVVLKALSDYNGKKRPFAEIMDSLMALLPSRVAIVLGASKFFKGKGERERIILEAMKRLAK